MSNITFIPFNRRIWDTFKGVTLMRNKFVDFDIQGKEMYLTQVPPSTLNSTPLWVIQRCYYAVIQSDFRRRLSTLHTVISHPCHCTLSPPCAEALRRELPPVQMVQSGTALKEITQRCKEENDPTGKDLLRYLSAQCGDGGIHPDQYFSRCCVLNLGNAVYIPLNVYLTGNRRKAAILQSGQGPVIIYTFIMTADLMWYRSPPSRLWNFNCFLCVPCSCVKEAETLRLFVTAEKVFVNHQHLRTQESRCSVRSH